MVALLGQPDVTPRLVRLFQHPCFLLLRLSLLAIQGWFLEIARAPPDAEETRLRLHERILRCHWFAPQQSFVK